MVGQAKGASKTPSKLIKNAIYFRHTSISHISFIPCLRGLASVLIKQMAHAAPEISFLQIRTAMGEE